MVKAINCRICPELEEELRYIQLEMKKKIADIDLSKPQASMIAARILNERRSLAVSKIENNSQVKKGRGRRLVEFSLI